MTAALPQHLSLSSVKLCCTKLRTENTPGSLLFSAQHIYLPFFIIQRFLEDFFLYPHEKPPNCLHTNVYCVA